MLQCTLVALISGFSQDVAELAAMNEAGALVHALVWLKPTPAQVGDGETAEQTASSAGESRHAPVASCVGLPAKLFFSLTCARGLHPTTEPTLVGELRQLASSASTWQAGVRKIALLEVDVAVPQVEEGEAEGETPPAAAEGEQAVSPALSAAQGSLVEAVDTLMDTLSAYDAWKVRVARYFRGSLSAGCSRRIQRSGCLTCDIVPFECFRRRCIRSRCRRWARRPSWTCTQKCWMGSATTSCQCPCYSTVW